MTNSVQFLAACAAGAVLGVALGVTATWPANAAAQPRCYAAKRVEADMNDWGYKPVWTGLTKDDVYVTVYVANNGLWMITTRVRGDRVVCFVLDGLASSVLVGKKRTGDDK